MIGGRLGGAALVLFLLDALVFRGPYPYYLGGLDHRLGGVRLWNEKKRERSGRPEILAVGDSRMPLFPRVANELQEETGYFFAGINSPGTSPRCWYYMLRDVDPDANLYHAILIPEYWYEDRDSWDRYDDRIRDLNYIVGQLKVTDIADFALSFHLPEYRLKAARRATWKGFVYQTDVREFLAAIPSGWPRSSGTAATSGSGSTITKDQGKPRGAEADWENDRFLYTDSDIPQERRDLLEKKCYGRPCPTPNGFGRIARSGTARCSTTTRTAIRRSSSCGWRGGLSRAAGAVSRLRHERRAGLGRAAERADDGRTLVRLDGEARVLQRPATHEHGRLA
ncbi:MAG: hypothetical protein R2748_28260 [Bryobacterales bacterium]